jgi:hypothetical protein
MLRVGVHARLGADVCQPRKKQSDTINMKLRAIPAGPESPVRVLPPALLSRAIKAFEIIQAREPALALAKIDFLTLLAILFDLCRTVFTENKSGPIAIYETDQMRYSLAIYGTLSLTPTLDDGIIRSIHLWPCSYTEGKRSEVFGGWRDLKHSIVAVVDGSAFSTTATARHGAIVRAAASVLRGCPYYPPAAARSIHKWRTKLVNLVCTPETIGSVAALAREVASRPRLFTVRGWCGGNVLHPCCRLGNVQQLQLLLEAIYSESVHKKARIQPTELIEGKNLDGCTPLYVARQYAQPEAARIMLEAGANPTIADRFSL